METAKISFRWEELTIWVSMLESCCNEFVHAALSDWMIVGLNLDKLLWMGNLKVCATTLTWGCSWNFEDHALRYWRQNSPASSRCSSPSMLNLEASNKAINPFISSQNFLLSLPLLSQNLLNMSVRCSKRTCGHGQGVLNISRGVKWFEAFEQIRTW